MKKFEGLTNELDRECRACIDVINYQLENDELTEEEKYILKELIKKYELYIKNIGQVARQYISRNVKRLMLALKETCMDNSYYSNFIWYLRMNAGFNFDDGFIQGEYPLQTPIINLGLTIDDMKFFMGKDPRDVTVYDEFTTIINTKMGAEIPTRRELREAKILKDIEPTEENIKRYENLKIRDGDVLETDPYTIYQSSFQRKM